MKDELSKQQTDAILKALDDAIEQGPWDDTNFLKAIGKKLQEIRDEFINQLQDTIQEQSKITALANRMAVRSGQQEIFISLYSSEGMNLQSWERILVNLPNQVISRPIYADEQNVKELLKIKEHKNNEAYVSIYVNQNDILPMSAEKTPMDKLGHALLTLKDKSIRLDNINCFIYKSDVYEYKRGRLIKKNQAEIS